MKLDLITSLYVFMLAAFIGFEVIRRVSPLLHTPLMSLTNALDAIAVVGAIILAGEHRSTLATVLGTIAIVAATSNVVGGFMITDRMLKMFKASGPKKTMTAMIAQRTRHRDRLPRRHGAVHPLAEMDELAEHGAARRPGRRARHAAGDRRDAAPPRDRRLQVDRHRAGARHDHRRAARQGADDGRAAADRAQPRLRRPLRHAGRHGGVLPARRPTSRRS